MRIKEVETCYCGEKVLDSTKNTYLKNDMHDDEVWDYFINLPFIFHNESCISDFIDDIQRELGVKTIYEFSPGYYETGKHPYFSMKFYDEFGEEITIDKNIIKEQINKLFKLKNTKISMDITNELKKYYSKYSIIIPAMKIEDNNKKDREHEWTELVKIGNNIYKLYRTGNELYTSRFCTACGNYVNVYVSSHCHIIQEKDIEFKEEYKSSLPTAINAYTINGNDFIFQAVEKDIPILSWDFFDLHLAF